MKSNMEFNVIKKMFKFLNIYIKWQGQINLGDIFLKSKFEYLQNQREIFFLHDFFKIEEN